MKYPYSIKDGIVTVSDPDRDRHVDIELTPEMVAMSADVFDERVLSPARKALL